MNKPSSGHASKPIVSVIIPTHNRAHCLPAAIKSASAQERAGQDFDVEVIVVDDGSTDATRDIVPRYKDVRYIRLAERRGVSAALNGGLRAAHGTYITFLGDDDTYLPHKLRVQVAALQRHPAVGVVYSQCITRFRNREALFPRADDAPSGRIFAPLLLHNYCGHHPSMLMRREVFERAGEFDETLPSYEDYDMSLRMAFHVPFLFVPGAVDIYNLSPHGLWLTRTADGSGAEAAARVIEKALQMIPQSRRYANLRGAARAGVKFHTASALAKIGDRRRAWQTVLAAVREHPGVLRYAKQRHILRWLACDWASAEPAPVSAMYECCEELESAAGRSNFLDRWFVRQTLGAICAEMALNLEADPRVRRREAALAAVNAIIRAPWRLRRKALLRLIVREIVLNGR